jgi:hypothetical protein
MTLAWLPPYPLRGAVTGYRIAYSTKADEENPKVLDLSGEDLVCSNIRNTVLTGENRCYKLAGLEPVTTYGVKVQARAESGNWGDWSLPTYVTTKEKSGPLGGSLVQIANTDTSIRVRWTPPDLVGDDIAYYLVSISVAVDRSQKTPIHNVSSEQREFTFKQLKPVTSYNVTVEGKEHSGRPIWYISKIFATTDATIGPLAWLGAPTNLHLIEKSDTMIHVKWDPPEILHPRDRELLTHYKVTIAPYNQYTDVTGPARQFTEQVPGTRIKWNDLRPETVYNITVEACTSFGCGEQMWGAYSTLPPPGRPHVLRLVYRTPTSLRVRWDPVWGSAPSGYMVCDLSTCTFTLTTCYSSLPFRYIRSTPRA